MGIVINLGRLRVVLFSRAGWDRNRQLWFSERPKWELQTHCFDLRWRVHAPRWSIWTW
jgi:hypothetical protein